ncbi:MAG: hypothetical protein V4668_02515 [Patescibacteria group bacterium]
MNGENKNEWVKDYEEFLEADTVSVPQALSKTILTKIGKLMDPSPLSVFGKVALIHAVVGFFSLSICHQFGVNPFGTQASLADWFMAVGGHSVCMIGCGILFMGGSLLASGYFLTLEETRALRRTGFPQFFGLGILSLGLLATLGAELALTIGGLWLLGAMMGGFVATEMVWKFKYIRVQKLTRAA